MHTLVHSEVHTLVHKMGLRGPDQARINPQKLRNSAVLAGTLESTGRDERIRTSDPHTPSVMRYQAALRPDQWRAGL